MEYTRLLKKGSTGSDVKYIKDCLFELGYYAPSIKKISSNTFGNDTVDAVEKYQKSNKDINGEKLEVDSTIGRKTWEAIERDIKNKKAAVQEPVEQAVKYTRSLEKGSSGDDVFYIKKCLFELNYFEEDIKKISSKKFGADTEDAVFKFQKNNKDNEGKKLEIDAVIGRKTWDAIVKAHKAGAKYKAPELKPVSLSHLTHISPENRKKIAADLNKVSELRREIVLEILEYACDASYKKEPRGMYQLGANLYNTDLKINYADKAETEKLAKRNPDYFDGGRKQWMLDRIEKDAKIPVADCSGMEVGYLRKHKLVKATFDTTANGLCGDGYSSAVKKSELIPGDWVGKSGHIGTYVGGGLVVEFYGGAYGCQLTKLDKREGYDFIAKRMKSGSKWTKYRRPKFY